MLRLGALPGAYDVDEQGTVRHNALLVHTQGHAYLSYTCLKLSGHDLAKLCMCVACAMLSTSGLLAEPPEASSECRIHRSTWFKQVPIWLQ